MCVWGGGSVPVLPLLGGAWWQPRFCQLLLGCGSCAAPLACVVNYAVVLFIVLLIFIKGLAALVFVYGNSYLLRVIVSSVFVSFVVTQVSKIIGVDQFNGHRNMVWPWHRVTGVVSCTLDSPSCLFPTSLLPCGQAVPPMLLLW